jgi:hypothetical protein
VNVYETVPDCCSLKPPIVAEALETKVDRRLPESLTKYRYLGALFHGHNFM